jgi:hypothetical protein
MRISLPDALTGVKVRSGEPALAHEPDPAGQPDERPGRHEKTEREQERRLTVHEPTVPEGTSGRFPEYLS